MIKYEVTTRKKQRVLDTPSDVKAFVFDETYDIEIAIDTENWCELNKVGESYIGRDFIVKVFEVIEDIMKAVYESNIPQIDISHWQTDLYLRKTNETEELINKYEFKKNVTMFIDQIDGVWWYDVPFVYREREVI